MKRFVSSFRARFAVTAVLLGVMLLMTAIYTNLRVHQDAVNSLQVLNNVKSTDASLQKLVLHLQNLKSVLYQHAVNFDSHSAGQALRDLRDIQAQVRKLVVSPSTRKFRSLSSEIKKLEKYLAKLDYLVSQLLQIQMLPTTRYPASAILLNELQPSNRRFAASIDLMLDEANAHDTPVWRELQKLLNDIRYYWAQNVSTVRVFVANRSGTFGEPDKVLPVNISTQKLYHDQIDKLLVRVNSYRKKLAFDIDFLDLIETLKKESVYFRMTFARVVKSFMSDEWRMDAALLNRFVLPVLTRTFTSVNKMRVITSRMISRQIGDSLQTSQTLSGFIWGFLAIVYLIVLAAYIVFERTIRRPLLEVAGAMDRQARGESDDLPVRRYYTNEAELLVRAFNNMKQQVGTRQVRLEAILRNAAEGIIILDSDGIIETFNAAAEFLFRTRAGQVVGQHVRILMGFDAGDAEEAMRQWVGSPEEIGLQRELHMQRHNEAFFMSIKVSTLTLNGAQLYISIVSDVTEQKAMLERLQILADMDSLTGLHNRRYFIEELDRVVEQVSRAKKFECALFFIDLDNFKLINDTLGHVTGDKVLTSVASVLRDHTRKSDVLARLGGDEFAILVYDVEVSSAATIADKFRRQLLENRVYEDGKELDVGCSIGVTMITAQGKSRDDLMLEADYACHLAKRAGRNRVHVYTEEDQRNKAEMLESMSWVQQIKNAIQHDHFVLAAQPIVEAATGRVTYSEMLLRLRGDDGKLIMPFGFIGAAERFDLMKEIDEWVISHSIQLLRQQMTSRSYVSSVSINLSAQSIGDEGVLDHIKECILRNGVRPDLIMFEITETVAIAHMEEAFRFLRRLRNMGCKTALDDFGSGYSSFGYLKELPVDLVKIDGSFVRNIETDELNRAMVKSMNDIAHVMGKQTVAEFVETREAMAMLKDMGVDYGQGFYLGRPEIIGNAKNSGDVISLVRDPE